MKGKLPLIILSVVCIALAVALIIRHTKANEQRKADEEKILYNSNQWQQTSFQLSEQRQVNKNLESDLSANKEQLATTSNSLVQTSATLTKTESDLKATQQEVAKRDEKITQLEAENQALDKQAIELTAAITNLNTEIEQTQQKLAATEGDKAFLQQELSRLMAEKAELERKFNDLAVLKAQVRKLKEELSIAKRMDWLRKGLLGETGEERGATKLMQAAPASQASQPKPQPTYDLNVEISEDGTVRIIPPATNSAPKSATP